MNIPGFAFLGALACAASAQTLLEHSSKARFQIDLQVPGDAVKAALPEGFTLNIAAGAQPRIATCA